MPIIKEKIERATAKTKGVFVFIGKPYFEDRNFLHSSASSDFLIRQLRLLKDQLQEHSAFCGSLRQRNHAAGAIQSPGEDFFSLLIPLNEICHVALSYLRMYACSPGTLWGEHPSEQVGSIVQHLGRNI